MSGTTNSPFTISDLRVRSQRSSHAEHGKVRPLTKGDHVNDHERLVELLAAPTVTITGSRAATSYGEVTATQLSGELANAGATLLVGGGYGIDAAAIRGALAAGGNVIVALASGVDVLYPQGHRELFDRVIDAGGLIISVQEDGDLPSKARFNIRQELIGALTGAVVIVEASVRSGALMLASLTAARGLPLYAVPGPITSVASTGPHDLLRSGAATLLTRMSDLGDLSQLTGTPVPHA